ncbi:MAG: hypothetical protein AMXMBFR13_00930 [Phycisphaerae bacterium]
MHTRCFSVVAAIALGLVVGLHGCGAPGSELVASDEPAVPEPSAVVENALIAAARSGAQPAELEALFRDVQVTVRGEMKALAAYLLEFDQERRTQVSEALTKSPLIEEVLENRIYDPQAVPDDPQYANQWYLAAIGLPSAWTMTAGDESMPVAVLDTGVDAAHVDLAGKVLPGRDVYENGLDTSDVAAHGTAVAGIIGAAANNATGIASTAWLNPILPVRVTSPKARTTSWLLAAGIDHAVSAGARVINLSFAPLHADGMVLRQAHRARLAGSLVIISAGNTGTEVLEGGVSPALFVSATDHSDRRASFSTSGPFVDLCAPGQSILSTKAGGQYASVSGTSFAAPVVAGVAALVWSVNPQFRPTTVRDILLSTAVDLGPAGRDNIFGHGRVNAAAAVQKAREIVQQADVTPPVVSIVAPAASATVTGQTKVRVRAEDNEDVAEVMLLLDGVPLATDAVPGYEFVLNASLYAAGPHQLTAVATDTAGNQAEASIIIGVGGPLDFTLPSVTLISPVEGARIRGVITIRADATDNRGLALAEVLLDGAPMASFTFQEPEAKIAYNWNATAGAVPGAHTVGVRVYDSSGNIAVATVQITVLP